MNLVLTIFDGSFNGGVSLRDRYTRLLRWFNYTSTYRGVGPYTVGEVRSWRSVGSWTKFAAQRGARGTPIYYNCLV